MTVPRFYQAVIGCDGLGGCGRDFRITSTAANEIIGWRDNRDADEIREIRKYAKGRGITWQVALIQGAFDYCYPCLGYTVDEDTKYAVEYVTPERKCGICGHTRNNGESVARGTFTTRNGASVDGCKHEVAGGVLSGYVIPLAEFV